MSQIPFDSETLILLLFQALSVQKVRCGGISGSARLIGYVIWEC